MRVSGTYLGVLGSNYVEFGSVTKFDFNSLPIIDLTVRHTVTSANVTINNGVAEFPASKNSFVEAAGTLEDYRLQRDFDWTIKFNAADSGFGYIGIIGTNSVLAYSSLLVVIRDNSNRIGLRIIEGTFPSEYTTNLYSANNTAISGLDYTAKVLKRKDKFLFYLNNLYIGVIQFTFPDFLGRRMFIGGVNTFAGNSFYGTIDDVDYRLLATRFESDFTAFPFTDITNRHVITNYGVTQQVGRAYFNNITDTDTNRLVIEGNGSDFNLQTDFDISFGIVVSSFAGKQDQQIFQIYDSIGNIAVSCKVDNSGRVRLAVGANHFQTSTGIIIISTNYNIRIERRGQNGQIYVNNVASAILTPLIIQPSNAPRSIILGADVSLGNQYGLYGTLDNFRFDVL